MGKDLKGKELGKGLGQRKDNGMYYARCRNYRGERKECCFKTLPEAKNWRQEQLYLRLHPESQTVVSPDMTVDAWFNNWINRISDDLAPNTIRNYQERYEHNIQPFIGSMRLRDVKPMDCDAIFKAMKKNYADSTIDQTYTTIGTFFKNAKDNGFIDKHPLDGSRYKKSTQAAHEARVLTVEEQKRFLEAAKSSHNYAQYALILETGLRTGEMIGLTWDAINWEKRTLTVNKTLEFRYKQDEWRAGPPKTESSYRTIPLTDTAYDILRIIYDTREYRNESNGLSTVLTFMDRKTGQKRKWSCVIWCSSTGAPECLPRTAPTTPTSTSCATKQGSNVSVCTLCVIHTLLVPLRAECSPKSYKSCWVMPAAKQQWIDMSM